MVNMVIDHRKIDRVLGMGHHNTIMAKVAAHNLVITWRIPSHHHIIVKGVVHDRQNHFLTNQISLSLSLT